MKRPVLLVVGAVAAALVIAGVGASAHTGASLSKFIGVHSSTMSDEAAADPTETPEPAETPEAEATEPAEAPDTDTNDNDTDEQGEDNDDQGENAAPAAGTSSGEHESGGDHEGSGTGKDD